MTPTTSAGYPDRPDAGTRSSSQSGPERALRLETGSTAPAEARRFVSSVDEIPDEYLDDVQLLVSEVVSNAVRHGPAAPSSVIVRVAVTGEHLRIEVEDDGDGFATPPDRSVDPPGVGLHLVDRLTDRWGIDAGGTTVVWFEWDLATR